MLSADERVGQLFVLVLLLQIKSSRDVLRPRFHVDFDKHRERAKSQLSAKRPSFNSKAPPEEADTDQEEATDPEEDDAKDDHNSSDTDLPEQSDSDEESEEDDDRDDHDSSDTDTPKQSDSDEESEEGESAEADL
jgi:hypothetical protein